MRNFGFGRNGRYLPLLGLVAIACNRPSTTYPKEFVGRWECTSDPRVGVIFKGDGSGNMTTHPLVDTGQMFKWRVIDHKFEAAFFDEEGGSGGFAPFDAGVQGNVLELKGDAGYFKCHVFKRL